ncbi:MAG: hypothetical protein ACQEV7_10355 [Bacillota bacterium]
MKINWVILVIIIILAVYIGSNNSIDQVIEKMNGITISKESETSDTQKIVISKEEQQTKFKGFESQVLKFVNDFEKIDNNVSNLSKQNISKVEAYNSFKELSDVMEQGQRLPLGNLVPEGFSSEHEKTMNEIIKELDNVFQYRKFAYEHFMEFLQTGNLEKQATAKAWLNDGQSSLFAIAAHLGTLKVDLGLNEEE